MPKISDKTKKKRDFDIFFLKLVQENKELLFNKFTAANGNITHQKKMDKWTEIRDLCANEGIEKFVGKTPEYVRDGIYGQFKKRTLEKVDNYKKSGSDGGRLTDAENLLLEIVDRESPTVVGLNVSETGQPMSTFEKELGSNTSQFVEESKEMGVQTKDSEVGPSQMQMLASNLNKRKRQASLDDQIKMAKLNCIKAQTELYNEQLRGLKLKNRAKSLEVFKTEASLGTKQTVLLDEIHYGTENNSMEPTTSTIPVNEEFHQFEYY